MKDLQLILRHSFLFLSILLLFASCEQIEDGSATVEGKIMTVIHQNNDYNLSADTIAGAKKDVFIAPKGSYLYKEDVETAADGSYRFTNLTQGTYTVYAYSVLPSGEKVAVTQTVEVPMGGNVTAPTIYTHEGKAYQTSMVRGKVWAKYIHNGEQQGSGWAYEHRVFIRRAGDPYHFDDVRVGIDGYFYFQQLGKGTYEIFTTTEDENEVPSIVSQTITIDETGKVYDLPNNFNVTINV